MEHKAQKGLLFDIYHARALVPGICGSQLTVVTNPNINISHDVYFINFVLDRKLETVHDFMVLFKVITGDM